ncbi:PINIT domain-containing protein [Epithele typhae]|uniref:PINIT domain-containing protein n=1 Tax=Epithele typhae TaxID=378194 RepID=UPI00200899E3|nr:PINIT domain-containing protein [Epithele typhae]KAH9944306.1 PINIT domain-containing protein [Epithele typhae]
MAGQDVWAEFETLRHNLRSNKVEQLKQILTGFNEECQTNFTKTGKKQDLIDKITRELNDWRQNDNVDRWTKGEAIMTRVRQTGYYTSHTNGSSSFTHTFPAATPSPSVPYQSGASQAGSSRYDPWTRRVPPAAPVASSSSTSAPPPLPPMPSIRFKYSPFFKVERLVSGVAECPESASSMDRRSQNVTFVMTNEVLSKVTSTNPKYQLRLYCTSSAYHTPPTANLPGAFRSAAPCPIEFPPTCEVRVNGNQLNVSLKGLKKKPGTAPPPDIGKHVRQTANASNRIEIIYVNSQQPTPPKKYYLVVGLVEVTSTEQLIDRLRKGKYKQAAEVLADMNKANGDDDDIVAGHQKMSLKCPLSYGRITTPCRSSACVHPQCFDALSWFSMMEQTTTWLCPVCEKVLNVEELLIDGYFDSILKATPEDVDDVIVEPDGEWHTEDNKFGSARWKAIHSVEKPVKPASPVKPPPSPSKPVAMNGANGFDKPRPSNAEIVILDSDDEDEDEGRVKRELSPSTDVAVPQGRQSNVPSSQPARAQAVDIIDLTLDSDEEEQPPPPPRRPLPPPPPPPSKKRKEADDLPSPTEQIWKKSRPDHASLNAQVPGSTPRMGDDAYRRLPPPVPSSSQPRYSSSQQTTSYRGSGSQSYSSSSGALPPPPSSLPARPTHEDYRNNTLPPLSSYPSRRGSGAGASSPRNWR